MNSTLLATLALIQLPAGFSISLFSDQIPKARGMALGSDGTVYVGSWDGDVYALPDDNRDFKPDQVRKIADGLNTAIGVAYRDDTLYIGEIHRIVKLAGVTALAHGAKPPEPSLVLGGLPNKSHHGGRYLAFGPDGKLYVGLGAPCNVCEATPPLGTVSRVNADGSGLETYARGVRNSVGFDWHPDTKELWFTDNGRDHLGDDFPPDELNRAPRAGMHFGFPEDCATCEKPALPLGPHVAALGMKFYRGKSFPAEYRKQIFIAEHGSWNRSQKIGYRISLARAGADGKLVYETFASGWLKDGKVRGRPADLLELSDGSLLVSDDLNGAIYRIRHGK